MANTQFLRAESQLPSGTIPAAVTVVRQPEEEESIVTRPSVDTTEAPTVATMSTSDDGSSESGDVFQQSIQVAIRMRPLNEREKSSTNVGMKRSPSFRRNKFVAESSLSWEVSENELGAVLYQHGSRRVDGKTIFQFDKVFGTDAYTDQLYDGVVRPIANAVVTGQHGTVFAYGQTGSGKTFTMQGDQAEETDGIIQMAALDLFRLIEASCDREFLVKISYMEIYNEKVRDLLGVPDQNSLLPSVKIREDAHQGLHIDCRQVVVEDAVTLLAFLQQGNHNRACAATDMNKQSSRSHAIFRVMVESRDIGGDNESVVRRATLNLVDLAGSENGKTTTGQRQKEGSKINKSLLSLSQVVHSLSLPARKRPRHINYRDSKLTRILQPHLSGNALIAVLCCVSPSKLHVEETRSTLRFAARAKLVQTKPKVNEVVDSNHMVQQLRKQLSETLHALEEMKRRGEVAEKESMRAQGELDKLKQIVYGSVEAEYESHEHLGASCRKRPRCGVSGISPVSDSSGNTGDRNVRDEQGQEEIDGVETDDHRSVSLAKPQMEELLGNVDTQSTDLDEEHSASDGKLPADRFDETAPRQLYADQQLVVSPKRHKAPPTEVTIISDNDTLGVSRRSELTQAMASAEAEARERFLVARLEEAEDLVESLMKDVSAARHCVRQLVMKNASLSTSVARQKRKAGSAEVKRDKLHRQQYMVLKYTMYMSLFFFFFNCQESFLACAMFLWLTLEVVT